MKLISIVFSFKNEEKNLIELVTRVKSSLSEINNWDYELIFINDSSSDKSEEILLELQKTNPIIIINMTTTTPIAIFITDIIYIIVTEIFFSK